MSGDHDKDAGRSTCDVVAGAGDRDGGARVVDVRVGLEQKLSSEAEAARSLLLNIRDVIGEDDEDIADAIEGETNFFEAVAAAYARLAEIEMMTAALADRRKALGERQDRLSSTGERIRTALCVAMGTAGVRKIELPEATLSLRAIAASAVVACEADIPSQFWRPQPPKLDKAALLKALKDGSVPGASLSNGGETISVRVK